MDRAAATLCDWPLKNIALYDVSAAASPDFMVSMMVMEAAMEGLHKEIAALQAKKQVVPWTYEAWVTNLGLKLKLLQDLVEAGKMTPASTSCAWVCQGQ